MSITHTKYGVDTTPVVASEDLHCPACGALVEANEVPKCPACGTAPFEVQDQERDEKGSP